MTRVARDLVVPLTPDTVSIMPAGSQDLAKLARVGLPPGG